MPVAERAVGFVDRPHELGEARRILHRPQPLERGSKQIHVTLRQQANRDDAFVRQG